MTDLTALLPCPFCGGEAKLVDATRILGVWRLTHRCPAMGPLTYEALSAESVAEAWNTRKDHTHD